jgi:VRR-NUC domain
VSEAPLMRRIMLAASRAGARIFRNNTGVAHHRDGSVVRYGVGNGGADLIGWRSVTVTPCMVGRRAALFLALEVKTPGGKPTPEQQRFVQAVREAGGIGAVVRSEAEALAELARRDPAVVALPQAERDAQA